ncbi:MAG: hypothetical protein WCH21_06660, partial [Bacteroidota bacterium]
MKKSTLLLSLSLFLTLSFTSQTSEAKFWSPITETTIKPAGKRQIIPKKYLTYQLNGSDLKTQLLSSPLESNVKINESIC